MQLFTGRALLEIVAHARVQNHPMAEVVLNLEISIGTGLLAGIEYLGIVIGLQDKVVIDSFQVACIGQHETVGLSSQHHHARLRLAKSIIVTSLDG